MAVRQSSREGRSRGRRRRQTRTGTFRLRRDRLIFDPAARKDTGCLKPVGASRKGTGKGREGEGRLERFWEALER